MKYGPVGFCIWCGKVEGTVPRLTSEHIVPEGLGGRDEIKAASCDKCADRTMRFEQNFMRVMYPAARAYWGLYGKRRKNLRPRAFPVQYGIGGTDARLDVADFPFGIFMPLLDPPRMLAQLPVDPKLPDLREPGRLWHWQAPDAKERAETAQQSNATKTIVVKQQIWLSDFYKTLAKIGHAYAIAQMGYSAIRPGLLPGLVRAPAGASTNGATSLVGGAFDRFGLRVRTIREGDEPFALQFSGCDFEGGRIRAIVVRMQLFAHIDAPVYDVVAAKQIAVPLPADMTKRLKAGTMRW